MEPQNSLEVIDIIRFCFGNNSDEDNIKRTSCGETYGPLRHVPRRGKALIKTDTRPWSLTDAVKPYNADYYQFGIDPGVTGIDLKLDGNDAGSFRYYVLGMKNNSVITQSASTDPDYAWEQTFPAGQYDKIAVIVVGMANGGSYKISIKRKLNIGDTYQGGIIFYLDGSGEHGLIAEPNPYNPSRAWWNGSNVETGATGKAVGTGRSNTKKIIAKQGAGDYAATVADNLVLNGYSDWFLPSIDELLLMYFNIGPGAPAPLTNIGRFWPSLYWSSTESDDDGEHTFNIAYALWFDIDGGGLYEVDRDIILIVRAVRAF